MFTHAGTLGMTICLRHFPAWMTSGILVPTGMLVRVNLPSTPVITCTSGEDGGEINSYAGIKLILIGSCIDEVCNIELQIVVGNNLAREAEFFPSEVS